MSNKNDINAPIPMNTMGSDDGVLVPSRISARVGGAEDVSVNLDFDKMTFLYSQTELKKGIEAMALSRSESGYDAKVEKMRSVEDYLYDMWNDKVSSRDLADKLIFDLSKTKWDVVSGGGLFHVIRMDRYQAMVTPVLRYSLCDLFLLRHVMSILINSEELTSYQVDKIRGEICRVDDSVQSVMIHRYDNGQPVTTEADALNLILRDLSADNADAYVKYRNAMFVFAFSAPGPVCPNAERGISEGYGIRAFSQLLDDMNRIMSFDGMSYDRWLESSRNIVDRLGYRLKLDKMLHDNTTLRGMYSYDMVAIKMVVIDNNVADSLEMALGLDTVIKRGIGGKLGASDFIIVDDYTKCLRKIDLPKDITFPKYLNSADAFADSVWIYGNPCISVDDKGFSVVDTSGYNYDNHGFMDDMDHFKSRLYSALGVSEDILKSESMTSVGMRKEKMDVSGAGPKSFGPPLLPPFEKLTIPAVISRLIAGVDATKQNKKRAIPDIGTLVNRDRDPLLLSHMVVSHEDGHVMIIPWNVMDFGLYRQYELEGEFSEYNKVKRVQCPRPELLGLYALIGADSGQGVGTSKIRWNGLFYINHMELISGEPLVDLYATPWANPLYITADGVEVYYDKIEGGIDEAFPESISVENKLPSNWDPYGY